jgi:hypothetical protein
MGIPSWATESSQVKAVDTPNERIKAERIKKTREKESADPELQHQNPAAKVDDLSEMQKTVEIQYEGDCLNYHGYTWSD